jgi:hypothetical protein
MRGDARDGIRGGTKVVYDETCYDTEQVYHGRCFGGLIREDVQAICGDCHCCGKLFTKSAEETSTKRKKHRRNGKSNHTAPKT